MTKVLAENQIEIQQRWMRKGNINIKLNAASERKKNPLHLRKGNTELIL